MGLGETLVIYLVAGVAVAAAMYLTETRRGLAATGFLMVSSALFWPLYLPLLLSARAAREQDEAKATDARPRGDEMSRAIGQVELELDAALSSLDGWAETALAGERLRIAELCHALAAQAERIREMDELLARSVSTAEDPVTAVGTDAINPTSSTEAAPAAAEGAALERWQRSQCARASNLERLAQVRRQAHADLMATLAWIRELVSMIHLAKFTGAPASRAEELIVQIAAAVEGVSAVARHEPFEREPDVNSRTVKPTNHNWPATRTTAVT